MKKYLPLLPVLVSSLGNLSLTFMWAYGILEPKNEDVATAMLMLWGTLNFVVATMLIGEIVGRSR